MRNRLEDRFWFVGLLCVLALGACASGQSGATTSGGGASTGATVTSLEIGPAGGKLTAPNGTSVEIPSGALAVNTTITLTAAPTAPSPGFVWVGPPYLFGPEGAQFAMPVTVTLVFSPNLIPAGHIASQIVVETAPVGSTSYTSLGGALTDTIHVAAQTTHFSIFGPAIAPPAGTTGGSSIGGEGTSTGSVTGGTGTGAPTSSGTGTTGGVAPDAGEESASSTSGGTGTGTSGSTGAGGTTGGTTGTPLVCVGASGCAVVSVLNGPGDAGNGANPCDYPFLDPVAVTASIANGNSVIPNMTSFNFSSGIWTVGLTMTACPSAAGGSIPVQANVALFPTQNNGACSNSPYTANGTIDFEPFDAGFAGTFQVALFGGMQGSFSFGQDPSLCDLPATADAGTVPEDAGATTCDSSNACLPDAGSLTGTGSFSLSDPGTFGTNWCAGPLAGLPAVATLTGSTNGPQIEVDFGGGEWAIEADLSCCPSGAGTLSATVTLISSICDPTNAQDIALSDAPGTVIFTGTGADLTGWITLDAGTLSSTASFDIPGP